MTEIIQIEDPEVVRDSEIIKENMNHKLHNNQYVWTCNCGSQLFFITPEGMECAICSTITNDWMDDT